MGLISISQPSTLWQKAIHVQHLPAIHLVTEGGLGKPFFLDDTSRDWVKTLLASGYPESWLGEVLCFAILVSLTAYWELGERPREASSATTGDTSRDQVGGPQASGLGKSFLPSQAWCLLPPHSSISLGELHSTSMWSTNKVNKNTRIVV